MNIFGKNRIKRYAFAFSMVMLILWWMLGMGTSLAWFNDTSSELKNVFHVAEFDLKVSHRLEDGSWEEVTEDTELFDKYALYEPGFTQVIYLKVENEGDIAFDWKTAVTVYGYDPGINVYGDSFKLQEHLGFGVVSADSEAELDAIVAPRANAAQLAKEPLNNYSSEVASLDPEGEKFLAIIVRMPEEVGNEANYVPPHQPLVHLGVIVSATQQHN